jgi:hypothetical protein
LSFEIWWIYRSMRNVKLRADHLEENYSRFTHKEKLFDFRYLKSTASNLKPTNISRGIRGLSQIIHNFKSLRFYSVAIKEINHCRAGT